MGKGEDDESQSGVWMWDLGSCRKGDMSEKAQIRSWSETVLERRGLTEELRIETSLPVDARTEGEEQRGMRNEVGLACIKGFLSHLPPRT